MNKPIKPNVLDYLDYRDFLNDYYEYKKLQNPNFSYKTFAEKTKIGSRNLIYMILKGRRNLTSQNIVKVSNNLELDDKKKKYFKNLVDYNQVDDPDTKNHYLKLLFELRKDRPGLGFEPEHYECLSKWYYPVIHELVAFKNFKESSVWISKALGGNISSSTAAEALRQLIKVGLLVRDDNGTLKQANKALTTPDEVKHVCSIQFHKQMMALASKDLNENMAGSNREISGLTMAVSEETFDKIKKSVVEFQDQIMNLIVNDNGDPASVAQLNFQLFSLASDNRGK